MQSNLLAGETLVYKAEVSWASFIPHILLMFVLVGFITVIFRYIECISTEIEITNRRILAETGFLEIVKIDFQLDKIENVSVYFDRIGEFLDYGDVVISTATEDCLFTAISNPYEFKSVLLNQAEAYNASRIKT